MKVIYKILAQYAKACKSKVQKTVYFQYFKFKMGHKFYKNWRKLTTLDIDVYYNENKLYAKISVAKECRTKVRITVFTVVIKNTFLY